MKKLPVLIFTCFFLQIIAAAVLGPYSCEWGNSVYFSLGIVCVIGCGAFILWHKHWDVTKRIGYVLLVGIVLIIVWIMGFLLGDFRIMCRLF